MISIGFWIAGIIGKTVSQQQAKRIGLWVGLPVILIGLALLAWGGKALYDRGVVEAYKDKRDATVAAGTLDADREATANALERANVTEAENARLENAMAEAVRADPAKGKSEVGPVQQSYFDTLPKRRN